MEMDRDKVTEWCIAGACSVAIHVIIILLFVFLGKATGDPAPQSESVAATREATPAPPPEPPPETDAPATTTTPSEPHTRNYETYTVKKGDTLSKLAKSRDSTIAELTKLNHHIKDINNLQPGDRLKLPAPK